MSSRRRSLFDVVSDGWIARRNHPRLIAAIHSEEHAIDEPIEGGASLLMSRPTPANQVAADERSDVHVSQLVSEAARAAEAELEEQPTRLFAGTRPTPAPAPLPRTEPKLRAGAVHHDATEIDVDPPSRRPPLPPRRESTWPRAAAGGVRAPVPGLPGPTPPSAAKTIRVSTRRALWFYPGLAVVAALSVVTALALVLRGGPEVHEISVHSLSGEPTAAEHILRPASPAKPNPVASVASPTTDVSPASTPPSPAARPGAGAADSDEDEVVEDDAEPEEAAPRSTGSHRTRGNTGILRVTSSVPAAVYVDGKYVGNTPVRRLSLPAGKHKLALENAVLRQSASLSIRIKPGSVLKQDVELDADQ